MYPSTESGQAREAKQERQGKRGQEKHVVEQITPWGVLARCIASEHPPRSLRTLQLVRSHKTTRDLLVCLPTGSKARNLRSLSTGAMPCTSATNVMR